MFAAFAGSPMILRLYGSAAVIRRKDPRWDELYPLFAPSPGARQLFDLRVELVQTSCGMAVPLFDNVGERGQLNEGAMKKGEQGLQAFWERNNRLSLDGKPTHIMEKNV